LLAGIERGALGNGPARQHAVDLEAEIVVQAGGVVLLDDELQVAAAPGRDLAGRLGGLSEIALGVVGGDTGHGSSGGVTDRTGGGSVTPPPPARRSAP